MHEITDCHRSLSGTNLCVTNRIRYLPVTMTGIFSYFNSISHTEDRYELRVTGTKCRLPDTMSGSGEIFILGADRPYLNIIRSKIIALCYASFDNTLNSVHIARLSIWNLKSEPNLKVWYSIKRLDSFRQHIHFITYLTIYQSIWTLEYFQRVFSCIKMLKM